MTEAKNEDRKPTPDTAEENAFFPSPYSLTKYTSSKTDFDGTTYPNPYKGGKWKVLMVASQERYLMMQNGKFFSTGNHPVEMLLPMYHMDLAGFEIDIATPSGDPVKLEMWAFPREDELVKSTYEKYRDQLKKPKKLSDVVRNLDSGNYIGIFIPGGHGVLNDVPFSEDVKKALFWAQNNDRYVISLCHGPAGLLAAGIGENKEAFLFRGYEMCVFPDSLDTGANVEIGYIPGPMPWLVGERLRELGVKILNSDITGKVHRDRRLLTGDSPLASNNLGKLAAETLLADVATR
ncbi:glyoxalase III HchA [Beijerinckia indica]|uniref:ThiJ/PfpI domain protein n=1 Tax=Beijerinckia indica subsp. indica (strain ATCC 9039 / DSM 1715 / NCIMB 8712) TaxID=395963 RepID=B2IIG0_BEII9|nr:glyoxalase III HchA [Beijerinckia indica]ACB96113.1 ThiJ/PfpI domain protein [Beijerinckia indica subsp. indica ATCC 9039]